MVANQDFELYRNGSSISSDTVGSLAALGTLTDIDLGQAYNTNNNGFHITKLSANDYVTCYYRVGGSSIAQPFFTTNNPVTSGIVKYAVAYTATTIRLFSNGTAQTESTGLDASAMTTLFQIDIGQRYAVDQQANMWIRAVALYKTRLTDDQLADLTS